MHPVPFMMLSDGRHNVTHSRNHIWKGGGMESSLIHFMIVNVTCQVQCTRVCWQISWLSYFAFILEKPLCDVVFVKFYTTFLGRCSTLIYGTVVAYTGRLCSLRKNYRMDMFEVDSVSGNVCMLEVVVSMMWICAYRHSSRDAKDCMRVRISRRRSLITAR